LDVLDPGIWKRMRRYLGVPMVKVEYYGLIHFDRYSP
jgi:hypothetical protein